MIKISVSVHNIQRCDDRKNQFFKNVDTMSDAVAEQYFEWLCCLYFSEQCVLISGNDFSVECGFIKDVEGPSAVWNYLLSADYFYLQRFVLWELVQTTKKTSQRTQNLLNSWANRVFPNQTEFFREAQRNFIDVEEDDLYQEDVFSFTLQNSDRIKILADQIIFRGVLRDLQFFAKQITIVNVSRIVLYGEMTPFLYDFLKSHPITQVFQHLEVDSQENFDYNCEIFDNLFKINYFELILREEPTFHALSTTPLMNILAKNSVLTSLKMNYWNWKVEDSVDFSKMIAQNKTLKCLDINGVLPKNYYATSIVQNISIRYFTFDICDDFKTLSSLVCGRNLDIQRATTLQRFLANLVIILSTESICMPPYVILEIFNWFPGLPSESLKKLAMLQLDLPVMHKTSDLQKINLILKVQKNLQKFFLKKNV